jgi:hypothetical protein
VTGPDAAVDLAVAGGGVVVAVGGAGVVVPVVGLGCVAVEGAVELGLLAEVDGVAVAPEEDCEVALCAELLELQPLETSKYATQAN